MIDRRDFLRGGSLAAVGLAGSGALLTARVAFAGMRSPMRQAGGAAAPAHAAVADPRLVLVILRGAMDGLAAVPPCGDPDYARLREEIAIPAPGAAGGALALDGMFALHPSFAFLHECYGAGELTVFHAVASPYRARSHFDGQDVLENGTAQPHALRTGWLNRALAALPVSTARSSARGAARSAAGGGPRELGVVLGLNVPLVMRGPAEVASWAPSRLAPLDDDTLARIEDLYAHDPLLARRLADALAAQTMAGTGREKPAGRYTEIIRAAAGFLRREDGPRVAVFDTNGWDTHANEGGARGGLGQRFAVLDAALRGFKEDLGPAWRETAIVLVTEFGRTVAVNGTRGTDHGTATAVLLLGGAIRGGRVVADWPGLAARALYEGRDLAPTLDLRSVLKGLLHEQLGVSPRALADSVFPQSAQVPPIRDLLRA
ncbi:MAG: DUF1501 domain-containing protein [Steroidobacteraceae bacterium]